MFEILQPIHVGVKRLMRVAGLARWDDERTRLWTPSALRASQVKKWIDGVEGLDITMRDQLDISICSAY
jgi:hypothetical protein